jgi:hypothetical protein
MAKPVSTPPSQGEPAEVITPLQKLLAGTFVLSLITVPVFSFVFYLAPFYKGEGALYRGTYWVLGAFLGIALSAAFSWFWMTMLPGILEKRRAKRDAAAVAAREERRAAKRAELAQARADRAASAAAAPAVVAGLAGEEE